MERESTMLNPIAPPAIQGIHPGLAAPAGYVDVPFEYTYEVDLAADELLNNEVVSIYTEADFAWRGLIFNTDGTFKIQFQDGQGYVISSGMVFSQNMPNTAGDPFPRFPEILYPAGGRIILNIQDTSGDDNTGQIIFMGVHQYKIG